MGVISLPLTLAEVKLKMELRGIVKRLELVGALVDVGLEREAFLHISQIKGKKIKNVEDGLSVGQEVTVWVQAFDVPSNRAVVTMFKPALVEWDELAEGQVYTGRVTRIEKFGAFVDFGAERPGLVHVSEMEDGYIESPEDVAKQGDEVQVKVIRVDRAKGKIDLSMKALATTVIEEEYEEEAPTAMAMAWQKAQKKESASKDSTGKRPQSNRSRYEDIFRRTLDLQEKE